MSFFDFDFKFDNFAAYDSNHFHLDIGTGSGTVRGSYLGSSSLTYVGHFGYY